MQHRAESLGPFCSDAPSLAPCSSTASISSVFKPLLCVALWLAVFVGLAGQVPAPFCPATPPLSSCSGGQAWKHRPQPSSSPSPMSSACQQLRPTSTQQVTVWASAGHFKRVAGLPG